jgi:hypothetical protein
VYEHRREPSLAKGRGEIVDQFGGRHEARIEAVLDRAIGDRHREMRLAATGLATQDQTAALGDEVRRECRAE